MKVVYVGPFDEVEVPAAEIIAKRNHQVEVTEEIGRSLIEQDIWRPAPTKNSGLSNSGSLSDIEVRRSAKNEETS